MRNKNERWLNLLKVSNIETTEEFSNGTIEKVFTCKDNTWKIHLMLDKPAKVENLLKLINNINKQANKKFNIAKIDFILSYRTTKFDKEIVAGYYKEAININSNIKLSVSGLNKFNFDISDDEISIYVGGDNEVELVNNLTTNLYEFLYKCGFVNYKIRAFKSQFETSIIEKHEEDVQNKEIYYNSIALEHATKQKLEIENEKKYSENKTKNRRKYIQVKIEELPTTNVETLEFKQKMLTDNVEIEGVIVESRIDVRKGYNIFQAVITNYFDSIIIKKFVNKENLEYFQKELVPNVKVNVLGIVSYDEYARDVVVTINTIKALGKDMEQKRIDEAEEKRVELHAHTLMSSLDSVLDIEEYVKTAAGFNHKAVAITDHGNCHILPDLFKHCKKYKIKPIAGVEGYYVDDSKIYIATPGKRKPLADETYVVFDIETTGFSTNYCEIIEIGAIKIKNGIQIDSFSEFVKPTTSIPPFITELTGISEGDVANAEPIKEVLGAFIEFIDDSILVAHNAKFDIGHIYYNINKYGFPKKEYQLIDTLELARVLYNDKVKTFNLKSISKYLKVTLENHHRAIHDAITTSNVFIKMLGDLEERLIYQYDEINNLIDDKIAYKLQIPNHINILVKNKTGLKNLYKIVSDSLTDHYHKEPRVLKSVIEKNREGLLISSGCSSGEIFKLAYEKSIEEVAEIIDFYDFIEIQPMLAYTGFIEKNCSDDLEQGRKNVIDTIEKIIKLCKEKNILVVATGDVHQLEKTDLPYREVCIKADRIGGMYHPLSSVKNIPNQYFMTTNEMIKEFEYLGFNNAYDFVVKNSNYICDQIEEFDLFPKKLFVPRDDFMSTRGVDSMAKAVRDISYETARNIYGDDLPQYIVDRLEVELKSIIGNGFASVYYISHMLVKYSYDSGYIVGSRGSVGSSFVATMMKITEVNALKPHYVCPKCKYSAFKFDDNLNKQYIQDIPSDINEKLQSVEVGFDLEDCYCPHCNALMKKDGVDIPFETFLGFEGKKVPDIDLNFSGEFQEKAHNFCKEVFGEDRAYRAGTIGTVAEKTAFAIVRKYYSTSENHKREAEIKRISSRIVGSKKTTGQHPGGIVVIPDDIEVTDLIPYQYPADKVESTWKTTHFDYHKFEENLLKLDILGHVDPTMVKELMDFVKENPDEFDFTKVEEIPLSDEKVLSLFSSNENLNLKDAIHEKNNVGTLGIPEFGTDFVRGMLGETKPKSFSEIIKISGLSHGTNVWLDNARDLVLGLNKEFDKVEFKDVIGCRDDIMVYLISKNLPAKDAFRIMESVRKGKGVNAEDKKLMIANKVDDWYIDSCEKIAYMFPKAHAVAYVIMALRIGWFKVYKPLYYYSAYFSVRADAFDVGVLAAGKNAIRNKILELESNKNKKVASNKEIDVYGELLLAYEMVQRGYSFLQVDIEKSDSHKFLLSEDKKSLYIPFRAIDALGEAAAESIVIARNEKKFTSKADVLARTKINKTVFAKLKSLGSLDNLPDNDDVTFM